MVYGSKAQTLDESLPSHYNKEKRKEESAMNKKIRWITETALMLAMLIALQWVTSYIPKPLGQFVTGSFVNAVLAVTVLLVGLSGGLTVALLSPIFAFLLNIAPNLVTVPAIMVGNAVFVGVLKLVMGEKLWYKILAWLAAAAAKFSVLYILVVLLICGVASQPLLEQGLLKGPMLKMLPAMFSWTQLVTALIGGGVALLMLPLLKKALKRK